MEEKDSFVILTRILGQKERASDELGTSVYENGPTEAGARPNPSALAPSAIRSRAARNSDGSASRAGKMVKGMSAEVRDE